jgi:hypothetical protein
MIANKAGEELKRCFLRHKFIELVGLYLPRAGTSR